MNKTAKYILFVLVFLFTGSIIAGNNKHFYKGDDGRKVAGKSVLLVEDYKLYQNFPNPFNPSTKISYKIKKDGFVFLNVYNLVGQVVRVLVNEDQQAGTYEVEFDAGDLPSGIYLYKLQINSFSSVKRMTLVK